MMRGSLNGGHLKIPMTVHTPTRACGRLSKAQSGKMASVPWRFELSNDMFELNIQNGSGI